MRRGGRLPLAPLVSLLCLPAAPAEREFAEELRVSLLQRPVAAEQLLEHGEDGKIPEMHWAVHDWSHAHGDYPVRSNVDEETRQRSDDLYLSVGKVLERARNASLHSLQIVRFLREKSFAPALGRGCLFLPSDQAWRGFYAHLERPYPPFFGEMIANSFYPDCGNVSLSGLTLQFCDDQRRSVRVESGCLASGTVGRAAPQAKASNAAHGPLGQDAAEDEAQAEAHGLEVHVLDGHVGLPAKWLRHVEKSHAALRGEKAAGAARTGLLQHRRKQQQRRFTDACMDNREQLPCVPASKKLVIPIRFVVCYTTTPGVDDTMIEDQVSWMTYSYRGRQLPAEEPLEHSMYGEDMQMEFELARQPNGAAANYVHDPDCAQWAFYDTDLAAKYNTVSPERYFTVVVISDDASGILGLATLPQAVQETSTSLLMIVSLYGFKNWARLNGYSTLYNEGDTMVHEGGHMFGLYHTFQGGCSAEGDLVGDTHGEYMPMYTCEAQVSDCPVATYNPVHNFMDYADDRCMSMFTIGQTRRAWCVMELYRPTLYAVSLQDM